MKNNNKKQANLPCKSRHTENWDALQKVYEEENLGNRDKDEKKHWIFRAEKRRKKPKHKDILKSEREKGADLSQSECYTVENKKGSYFQTSLDKAFVSFEPDKKYSRQHLEKNLLREFQRKAHHHLKHVPKPSNTIEWLTLLQHYSGPTRLLDWTYSFYVALFFALAELDCEDEYAEVWATSSACIGKAGDGFCNRDSNLKKLLKPRKEDATKMDDLHNAILDKIFKKPEKQVFALNSFRLNDRLIIQQGVFLVQGDINKSFDNNLKGVKKLNAKNGNLLRIIIDINIHHRNDVLKELNRMNINEGVLLPGLQGFAESLRTQLAYPEKFG